jgi:hypothetical protein
MTDVCSSPQLEASQQDEQGHGHLLDLGIRYGSGHDLSSAHAARSLSALMTSPGISWRRLLSKLLKSTLVFMAWGMVISSRLRSSFPALGGEQAVCNKPYYIPSPVVFRQLAHAQQSSNVSQRAPGSISEVDGPCPFKSSQFRSTPSPSVHAAPLKKLKE